MVQTTSPPQSIVTAINAINVTETIIEQAQIGSTVQAGDTYFLEGFGTCTTTAGNLSTFTVRVGPTGTTSDLAIGTVTATASANGSSMGFYFRIMLTFRAIGKNGIAIINGAIQPTSVSTTAVGICSGPGVISANVAPVTVDTTNQTNWLSLTYKTGATTTTSTFQNVSIYKVK